MPALSIKSRDTLDGYLMILPNFVGFLAFGLVPVLFTVFVAFTKLRVIEIVQLPSLINFVQLFKHDSFRIALKNTLIFSIVYIPGVMFAGLVISLLLNNRLKGIVIFRTIYFLPFISSMVAIALVFVAFFHPEYGFVNGLLRLLGINSAPTWIADPQLAMVVIEVVSIWKMMGYFAVIYLAGLQGIPDSLYESATMDGASWFRKIRSITIPMLIPVSFFCFTIAMIQAFNVFEQTYVMTEGGPGRSTTTIVYYIYKEAFTHYHFGRGAAGAVVLLLLVVAIAILQDRLHDRLTPY